MMPPLTPRQSLELLLHNDERNIRDTRGSCDHYMRMRVVVECAKHWVEACRLDDELERRAKWNLLEALEGMP